VLRIHGVQNEQGEDAALHRAGVPGNPALSPSARAGSKDVVDGRHLTIQTSAGELRLALRKTSVPAEPSASVTTPPAG
jgi:hypothetical protein